MGAPDYPFGQYPNGAFLLNSAVRVVSAPVRVPPLYGRDFGIRVRVQQLGMPLFWQETGLVDLYFFHDPELGESLEVGFEFVPFAPLYFCAEEPARGYQNRVQMRINVKRIDSWINPPTAPPRKPKPAEPQVVGEPAGAEYERWLGSRRPKPAPRLPPPPPKPQEPPNPEYDAWRASKRPGGSPPAEAEVASPS